MNILTSSYTLDLAGVPTFTLTMYEELRKRGHNVMVYSPLGGRLETKMNTYKDLDLIPKPDIIIAQHTPCADTLHAVFPDVPLIFYSHSIWVEIDQPPIFEADWYFVINEAVFENLKSKGVPESKITIIRDFVDTEKFAPTAPIHKKLEQVLFISNYKKWKNFKMVDAACKQLGVKLKCVGAPYGRSHKIEDEINKADLIISWGRGILEAMSCGRAVVSFEKLLGDGYISEENYFEARKDNFCGYLSKGVFTTNDDLVKELMKYDSNSGKVNRDFATNYHDAVKGVDLIYENIRLHIKKV